MKKLNSKMLDKKQIVEKMEMSTLFGGAITPNGSDKTYNDTYNITTKKWDIAQLSALDINETLPSSDNPKYEPPTQAMTTSLPGLSFEMFSF